MTRATATPGCASAACSWRPSAPAPWPVRCVARCPTPAGRFVEDHYSLERYQALALLAARHHLRVNTIISGGAPPVLDVWETIDREVSLAGPGGVLVHGRVLPPDLLPRIQRLGAVVTTVPSIHVYRDGRRVVAGGTDPDHVLPHRALTAAGSPGRSPPTTTPTPCSAPSGKPSRAPSGRRAPSSAQNSA